jgi:hypothetical protein
MILCGAFAISQDALVEKIRDQMSRRGRCNASWNCQKSLLVKHQALGWRSIDWSPRADPGGARAL